MKTKIIFLLLVVANQLLAINSNGFVANINGFNFAENKNHEINSNYLQTISNISCGDGGSDEITTILSEVILMNPVKYNEVRFTTDVRNESLGKKIREATSWKVPVQLIIGPKDAESREVSVRTQSGEEKVALANLRAYLESK